MSTGLHRCTSEIWNVIRLHSRFIKDNALYTVALWRSGALPAFLYGEKGNAVDINLGAKHTHKHVSARIIVARKKALSTPFFLEFSLSVSNDRRRRPRVMRCIIIAALCWAHPLGIFHKQYSTLSGRDAR